MTTSQSSRLFASGHTTTLCATVPAQLVTDSQFRLAADEAITVAIEGERLIITADNLQAKSAE